MSKDLFTKLYEQRKAILMLGVPKIKLTNQ